MGTLIGAKSCVENFESAKVLSPPDSFAHSFSLLGVANIESAKVLSLHDSFAQSSSLFGVENFESAKVLSLEF
jgi:hypothetical protein